MRIGSLKFSFTTTSGAYTSFSMAIEEVSDQVSTVMALNSGTFPNPDILTADSATVGKPWTASLTLGLTRTKTFTWILYFGSAKIAPPNGVPVPVLMGGLNFGTGKAGKMILCAVKPGGFSITTAHSGVSGSVTTTAAQLIPKALGLVCNGWCAQAIVLGVVQGNGNARLSSMVMGNVGSKAP